MQIKRIKKNSLLGLICPAGRNKDLERSQEFIDILKSHGFRVKEGKSLYARDGYLAGSDELRAKDIMDMFLDDDVDAILCYKGGFGVTRLLDLLDFNEIKKHPKLLIGFSDVTALLISINQLSGIPTIHGEMGVRYARADEFTKKHFFDCLLNDEYPVLKNQAEEAITINSGKATGQIIGGNLCLIHALMGTPYEIDTDNKILFIEEVNEAPYKIDRMLSTLRLAGKFKNLKGVILGKFSGCDDTENNGDQQLSDLINTYFKNLNVPVLANFESGHAFPFLNIPFGVDVEFDADKKTVNVLKSLFFDK